LSESDEALVGRSRHGDRAAFEELVRRTARLVFSRCYLEVGDVHRAEDLVQETFLTAWKSIRQVNDAAGFRSWLLTIAHTVVIDAQRREGRKKRSGRHEGPGALSDVIAKSAGPAEETIAGDERDRVLSVLRSLPDEYRGPLTLRYFAGADYETIGRELGLTNGSLRGLLHRGMELLRRELSKGRTREEAKST
jgi:RNA polymerase sigma-70 factor, ECF subfamily